MCRTTTCNRCKKTTWAGCGQHVDQVMRGVPASQRCDCSASKAAKTGLLSRLLRRS